MLQLLIHPVTFIFVILPLLSIVLGALLYKSKWLSVLFSFFIPPIFFIIVSGWDLRVVLISFDAWILYGTFYSILSYITVMIIRRRRKLQ
ncbi:hypothetical protein V7183_16575 [Bacillus sp. JJ1127]|uniref:hypothetical protein n=1 Tax=Bacillus sp. JJ1127 TaxID=3122952 RepID=UPI003000C6FF